MAGPDLRPLAGQSAQPSVNARMIRDWTRGRQWGVDSARYGRPYVFARIAPDAMWMIYAGPFADEDAAIAWIQQLK
jgi:hypothetical protein